MNKTLVTSLKFAASAALLFVLWSNADEPLARLRGHSIQWGLFALAFAACLAATVLSFLRWRLLVRLLDLKFSIGDSLRLGFLGYMMNFFSLGAVGGDLLKAVAVAREQPGRRAEAVATVVVDRVIGLFALMLLAATSIILGQTWKSEELRTISWGVIGVTSIVGVCIVVPFTGAVNGSRMVRFLGRIPKLQHHAVRLLLAVALYRRKRAGLAVALGISLAVHGLLTLSIHLAAAAMFDASPSIADHFVACPLALLTGILPLPLGSLGALEFVLATLYPILSPESPSDDALLVGGAYRTMTIAIALVGLAYYVIARRKIAALREPAAILPQ